MFNFNGKYKKAINKNISHARKAMFALLTKATNLHLPIDITLSLFDSLVLPILLYGCEIWGFENCDQIEVFYRKFLKRILNLNKYTPNCIVYGEVGKMSLKSIIHTRMATFWCRIVTGKQTKLSFILYSLTKSFNDDISNTFKSSWISKIKEILSHSGLGYNG
jgi:hypothetical protein